MLDDAISLDASPRALPQSGSWVTVNWQGVVDPTPTDFVVVYNTPGGKPDPAQLAPVKYQYAAAADPRHLESGSGQVKFKLLALSGDYRFGFCRGNASMGVLAAWSEAVSVGSSTKDGAGSSMLVPLQRHLALTGTPSEMRVTWKTSGLEAPAAGAQQVQYAKAGQPVGTSTTWASSPASSLTFGKEDLCGEPAQTLGFLAPGYVHTAVMRGLEPATRYDYRVGDPKDAWSTTYSFRTGPSIGPLPAGVLDAKGIAGKEVVLVEEDGASAVLVKMAFFADMSSAEEDGSLQAGWFANDWKAIDTIQALTRQVLAEEIDVAMCIGDLSYASGYLSRWDSWLDQMEPVAARVPLMTTPGNHERDDPQESSFYTKVGNSASLYVKNDGGGECGVPYAAYFSMGTGPGEDPRGDQPWYSFDYGPVHVTVASTEHDFREGSPQYAWLAHDLSQVDRKVTPWVVFAGHRPFYLDSTDDPDPADSLNPSEQGAARLLRTHLEPLLLKHHVDLVLAGHHHSYQRTCKVAGGECVAEAAYRGTYYKAPVHAVIGMAGRRLSVNFMAETPAFFEAVAKESFGTTTLEATPSRLVLTFRDSVSDEIVDQTVLHAPIEHRIHPEEENDDEAFHKNHHLPPSVRRRPSPHLAHAAAVYWVLLLLGLALFVGSLLLAGGPGWWLRFLATVAGNGGGGGGRPSRDKHDMSPAPPVTSEMTPLTGSSLDGSGSASKRYRTGSVIRYADAV